MEVNQVEAVVNRPRGKLSWFLVVVSLISSMFLFALDNTIVANVQPSIIKSLGDVDLLPWVSVSYPLGVVGLNLLQTNIFMLFDNKILYIGSVIIFEIGSAVCGAAPNMAALIVGRLICGLGGCGIYVGAMNLLSFMTTEVERPKYLSLVGLTWGVGTVTGPLIGAAFTESSATWRWCFYINLCVGCVVAPAHLFLLPSQNTAFEGAIMSRLRGLDWVGAIVNCGAIISLTMAISFGGGLYPWSSGQIIGLFVCSGVLWVAFFVQQTFSLLTPKERRIFPTKYLKSRDMILLFGSVMCAATVVYIPLYFIPLYFQFAWNDTSLQSAVRLLPLVCFQVFGVILSGALMNKVGYYFPWYLAGGIFSLIGGVLLHLVDLETRAALIYGYSILVGFGSGLYVQTGYAVSQLLVSAEEIPKTVAFIGYGHISGVTMALTIGGSVFLNQATDGIAQVLPSTPRTLLQQAITGAGGGFFETIPDEKRDVVLGVIAKSIGNVYGIVIFAASMSIILSLFMRRRRLDFSPAAPTPDTSVDTGKESV